MIKDTKNGREMPIGSLTFEDLVADLKSHISEGVPVTKKPVENPRVAFPLEVLPPPLHQFVSSAEKALGTPIDFLATAILFAVSVAVGNTHLIELKRGSRQSGLLFLILIGNPNSNKTKALQVPLQPIFDRDSESYENYRREMAEYEVVQTLSKKERDDAGMSGSNEHPIWKKIIIQDATPEAVANIHLNNLRGIAIYRDEIAGWFKGFNRYNSGGEQEFWLSTWSGTPISVDRKTSDPVHIRRPFIPISGTIQPGILEELAKDNRRSNGFVDRLLFVWPDGLEKPMWTEDEMPIQLRDTYNEGINKLLDLTFDEENKPHVLSLCPTAKKRLFLFFNKENKPLCDQAENELLKGIYGKFDLHTARLCLILQMLWWAFESVEKDQIELQTVERAIKLTEFFRANALKVYDRLQNDNPVDRLTRDKQKVYEALPSTFKTADGIAIAERLGMKDRTFKRLLKDKNLFEKMSHCMYEKSL